MEFDVEFLLNDDSVFTNVELMKRLREVPKHFEISWNKLVQRLTKQDRRLNLEGYMEVLDKSQQLKALPINLNIHLAAPVPDGWTMTIKFRNKRIDGIDYEPVDYSQNSKVLGWHRHLNDSLGKEPLQELNNLDPDALDPTRFLRICFKILNVKIRGGVQNDLFSS